MASGRVVVSGSKKKMDKASTKPCRPPIKYLDKFNLTALTEIPILRTLEDVNNLNWDPLNVIENFDSVNIENNVEVKGKSMQILVPGSNNSNISEQKVEKTEKTSLHEEGSDYYKHDRNDSAKRMVDESYGLELSKADIDLCHELHELYPAISQSKLEAALEVALNRLEDDQFAISVASTQARLMRNWALRRRMSRQTSGGGTSKGKRPYVPARASSATNLSKFPSSGSVSPKAHLDLTTVPLSANSSNMLVDETNENSKANISSATYTDNNTNSGVNADKNANSINNNIMVNNTTGPLSVSSSAIMQPSSSLVCSQINNFNLTNDNNLSAVPEAGVQQSLNSFDQNASPSSLGQLNNNNNGLQNLSSPFAVCSGPMSTFGDITEGSGFKLIDNQFNRAPGTNSFGKNPPFANSQCFSLQQQPHSSQQQNILDIPQAPANPYVPSYLPTPPLSTPWPNYIPAGIRAGREALLETALMNEAKQLETLTNCEQLAEFNLPQPLIRKFAAHWQARREKLLHPIKRSYWPLPLTSWLYPHTSNSPKNTNSTAVAAHDEDENGQRRARRTTRFTFNQSGDFLPLSPSLLRSDVISVDGDSSPVGGRTSRITSRSAPRCSSKTTQKVRTKSSSSCRASQADINKISQQVTAASKNSNILTDPPLLQIGVFNLLARNASNSTHSTTSGLNLSHSITLGIPDMVGIKRGSTFVDENNNINGNNIIKYQENGNIKQESHNNTVSTTTTSTGAGVLSGGAGSMDIDQMSPAAAPAPQHLAFPALPLAAVASSSVLTSVGLPPGSYVDVDVVFSAPVDEVFRFASKMAVHNNANQVAREHLVSLANPICYACTQISASLTAANSPVDFASPSPSLSAMSPNLQQMSHHTTPIIPASSAVVDQITMLGNVGSSVSAQPYGSLKSTASLPPPHDVMIPPTGSSYPVCKICRQSMYHVEPPNFADDSCAASLANSDLEDEPPPSYSLQHALTGMQVSKGLLPPSACIAAPRRFRRSRVSAVNSSLISEMSHFNLVPSSDACSLVHRDGNREVSTSQNLNYSSHYQASQSHNVLLNGSVAGVSQIGVNDSFNVSLTSRFDQNSYVHVSENESYSENDASPKYFNKNNNNVSMGSVQGILGGSVSRDLRAKKRLGLLDADIDLSLTAESPHETSIDSNSFSVD